MATEEKVKPVWLEDWSNVEEDEEKDIFCPWLVVTLPDDYLHIDASNIERAKLAAKAPELARLLIKLELVEDGCPICEATIVDKIPHAPSCKLDALLGLSA